MSHFFRQKGAGWRREAKCCTYRHAQSSLSHHRSKSSVINPVLHSLFPVDSFATFYFIVGRSQNCNYWLNSRLSTSRRHALLFTFSFCNETLVLLIPVFLFCPLHFTFATFHYSTGLHKNFQSCRLFKCFKEKTHLKGIKLKFTFWFFDEK